MRVLLVLLVLMSVPLLAERRVVKHEGVGYPSLALSTRMQGVVVLKIDLSSDGMVTNVSSTGDKILADYCEKIVKDWVFSKGQKETVNFVFIFRIVGSKKEEEILFDEKNLSVYISHMEQIVTPSQ